MTIWDELPRLRDPDRFDAWTLPAHRPGERRPGQARASRRPDRPAASRRSEPPAIGRPDTDAFGRIADRDQLERGFRRLTPDQRAVLVLQHYNGLSLAEIADVLGIPIGTAGSRIHHATRALRAAIDADDRLDDPKERTA